MPDEKPIADEEWRTIVGNIPIVSVDLVVYNGGKIVLGKRTNEPAKGEWFVPGGTLLKHEKLEEAVHRLAAEELNIEVTIESQIGVYEHIYDVAEIDGVDGKHYIPVAFLVTTTDTKLEADDQHRHLEWFSVPTDLPHLHSNVEVYLKDADLL